MSDNYNLEIHRLLKIGFEEETEAILVPQEKVVEPKIIAPAPKASIKKSVKLPSYSIIAKAKALTKHNFWQSKYNGLLVYPAVFLCAFLFFYFMMNLPSFVSQVQGFTLNKSQDEQVLKDRQPAYNAWIQGYYFAVGNKALLTTTSDLDKDGLSNMDEFILRTNPTVADSDSDGMSDGVEVINQTNPWGDGPMTRAQLKLAQGVDFIMINNRVSYNASSNTSKIEENKLNFDLSKPGRLSIPKLGMQVPLIFSKTPDDFDADLTKGVVHYPGTVLPGEKGVSYISGHSSDYLWKKHPYKQVFAKLNFLEPGDDIFIDVYGVDGKLYNYRYKVSAEKIYKPDDQTQFIDNSRSILNLSTCWPIGTQKDRYVVSATLVGL